MKTVAFIVVIFCTILQNNVANGQWLDGLFEQSEPLLTGFEETMDDIITPSKECKDAVDFFGSAVSKFTLCSVKNARPIHLCQWCVANFLAVEKANDELKNMVDEKGKKCGEYFTSLDKLEIVQGAYDYVKNLWTKGKCEFCFQKITNVTVVPDINEELTNFNFKYGSVISCFNDRLNTNSTNSTCTVCKGNYEDFNNFSISLIERDGENVCLDVVDTINSTRDVWSRVFNCVPTRKEEFWLPISMSVVAVIPIIFYLLSYLFSNVQEANVLHTSRLLGATMHNGSFGPNYRFSSNTSVNNSTREPGPSTASGSVSPKDLDQRETGDGTENPLPYVEPGGVGPGQSVPLI